MVVPRHEMKATVSTIARILMKQPAGDDSKRMVPPDIMAVSDAFLTRLLALHPRSLISASTHAQHPVEAGESGAPPPAGHFTWRGTNGKGSTQAFLRAMWKRRASRSMPIPRPIGEIP